MWMHLLAVDPGTAVPGGVDITNYIQSGGIVGLVVFILLTGAKKLWVFGWIYRDRQEDDARALAAMAAEKDAWRETALKSAKVATDAFDQLAKYKGA